jgi:hypothetical protein
LAAAKGSAGSKGGVGQRASIHSRSGWLSHKAPSGVVTKGILPSGEADSTASSLLCVAA